MIDLICVPDVWEADISCSYPDGTIAHHGDLKPQAIASLKTRRRVAIAVSRSRLLGSALFERREEPVDLILEHQSPAFHGRQHNIVGVNIAHVGQIDQIDHDLDHLHPQIDHDLDHLNLNLPL